MAPRPGDPPARRLPLLLGCLLFALAPSAGAQAVWTVTQGGGGHFDDLQAAVDAAAPGDTLLVGPGDWGPVAIAKPLTLLGAAAGDSAGAMARRVRYLTAAGAPWLRLRGLRFDQAWLQDLGQGSGSARSLIEDCMFGALEGAEPFLSGAPALFSMDNQDLLIQGSVVRGFPGSQAALAAAGSGRLHLVQLFAYGPSANGTGDLPHAGGHALWLAGAVDARAALCFLQGGSGQAGHTLAPKGGAALQLSGGAVAQLVGYKNLIIGGTPVPGPGLPGPALRCPPGSDGGLQASYVEAQVVFGAVEPCYQAAGGLWPFAVPGAAPGGRRVWVYGAQGDPAALLLSLGSAAASFPGIAGEVGIDPLWMLPALPLVCTGYEQPSQMHLPVPSETGLTGLTVHGQVLVLTAAGPRVSNPFAFALGP